MNYKQIQKQLNEFNPQEVSTYLNYLKVLAEEKDRQGNISNKWAGYQSDSAYVYVFKKVQAEGLSIDGEMVTLQFRGKLMVSYNYQAYKNKVLVIYPDSLFDVQVVYQGDDFSFRKESGRVIYSHSINDPFSDHKTIIGAYCVIKNTRGEFLETINMEEINKMKNVAKTKVIWDAWFGEMVKKSIIKRACKLHFKDLVASIETVDNENYDLDNVNISAEIQKKINNCKSVEDLKDYYDLTKGDIKDEERFLFLINDRKEQLKLAEIDESVS